MAGQILKVTGTIPVGSNQAVAHGLIRPPTHHVLGVGSGANLTKGTAPNGVSAFYTNGGGASQPVVALLVAAHSLLNPYIALVEGSTSGAGAGVVAHGLGTVPDFVFAAYGTHSAIAGNPITVDATNINYTAGGAAQAFSFFAVKLHSEWGTGQWASIVSSIPAGANRPLAHGLIRIPALALLGVRTAAGVTVGTNQADATNVYISNSNGGAAQVEILLIAGHSVIA